MAATGTVDACVMLPQNLNNLLLTLPPTRTQHWRAYGLVDHWPREAQPNARDT
ncbi:MAG TPA: hypothetical protein VIU87_13650 [Mycobacterium sp.]